MQSLNESRKRQRLRSSCLRAIFPLTPWSINLDVVMTLILTLHSKLQLIPNTCFLALMYVGEYITLYQTQRNALKSYYKDREKIIAQLSSEKANMQVCGI